MKRMTTKITDSAKKLAHAPGKLIKTPTKFQFDIVLQRISGTRKGGKYAIKWTRGLKVALSKPAECTSSKKTIDLDQKLSLMCTLYRDDASGSFETKDAKFSLLKVADSGEEKTVGKAHFDLADFVGVPSAEVVKQFDLGNGLSLTANIICTFKGSSSGGPGSVSGSSISGVSLGSTSVGGDSDRDDLSDLDVEEEKAVSSRLKSLKSTAVIGARSDSAHKTTAVSRATTSAKLGSSFASERPHETGGSAIGRTRTSAGAVGFPKTEEKKVNKQVTLAVRTEAKAAAVVDPGLERENKKLRLEVAALKSEMVKKDEEMRKSSASTSSVDKERKNNDKLNEEIAKLKDKLNKAKETYKADLEKASSNAKLVTSGSATDCAMHSKVILSLQRTQDMMMKEVEDVRKMNDDLNNEIEELEQRLDADGEGGGNGSTTPADDFANARLIKKKNEDIAELEKKNSELEKKLTALQQDVNTLGSKATATRTLEQEKKALEAKLKSQQEKLDKWKKTHEDLSAMYDKARAENKALKTDLAEAKKSAHGSRAVGASSSKNEERLGNDLEATKAKLKAVKRENLDLNQHVNELQVQLDDAKREVQIYSSRSPTTTAPKEGKILESKVKTLTAQKEKITETYNQLKVMYDNLRDENVALQKTAKSSDKDKELRDLRRLNHELDAQLDVARTSLEDLQRNNLSSSRDASDLEAQVKDQERAIKVLQGNLEESHKQLADTRGKFKETLLALTEAISARDVAEDLLAKQRKASSSGNEDTALIIHERDEAISKYEKLSRKRNAEASALKDEMEELRYELEKAERKTRDMHEVTTERDKAIEDLDNLRRQNKQDLAGLRDESEEAKRELHRLERQAKRDLDDEIARADEAEAALRDARTRLRQLEDELEDALLSQGSGGGGGGDKPRAKSTGHLVGSQNGGGAGGGGGGSAGDEMLLMELVMAKMSLANAEEENLKYKNMVKKLMKGDKTAVLKMAQRASQLEVQLAEARAELSNMGGGNRSARGYYG